MRKRIIGFAMAPMLACSLAQAADFQCQDDVKPQQYTAEEQQLVDQFWDEALVYLREYLHVLETPTGQCKDSAEATIQTYHFRNAEKADPLHSEIPGYGTGGEAPQGDSG